MRYVIVNKDKVGADPRTHLTDGRRIILNEREVMKLRRLEGTLEERVAALGGEIYKHTDIKMLINKETWYYGN